MSLYNAALPVSSCEVQPATSHPPPPQWTRDAAVDFFRGLGLWMIYLDHLDHNSWSNLTLWRFGFSDFAEVFVFLSGFMSVGSWEKLLTAGNAQTVINKLLRRMARLYIAHVVSLILSIALLWVLADRGVRVHDPAMYLWMRDPAHYLVRVLTLLYTPGIFTLFLLYITVAPLLPLAVLGLKHAPKLTLGLSSGIWLLIQIPRFHSLGMSWHWYFNPLAWQFMFVLGAAVRYYSYRLLPIVRSPWAVGLAACVVAASAALKSLPLFPWNPYRISDGFQGILIPDPGKPNLAWYRVAHFLALVILVHAFTSRHRRWLGSSVARWAILCGRNSLVIFASSLVLDIAGDSILAATHGGSYVQLVISAAGVFVLCVLAWLCGRGAVTFKRPLTLNQIRNSIE